MAVHYLAGPMTNYPQHNHPAFHAAAVQLRACGHTIINPAEYGDLVTGWQECMKRDIHALLWCDAVIVLPGWERSRGATLEVDIARRLDMGIYELHVMLCDCRTPGTPSNGVAWHSENCLNQRIPLRTDHERIHPAQNRPHLHDQAPSQISTDIPG